MRNALNCSILDRLPDAELLAKTDVIYESLIGNEFFPESAWHPLGPTPQKLASARDKYRGAYNAAITKDVQKIALRNEARAETVDVLKGLASVLELMAWNDLPRLQSTAYDLRRGRSTPASYTSLGAPELQLLQSEHRGVLVGRVKRVRGAVSYEVQICEGDPTTEENWRYYGVYGATKMEFTTGLEPGKQYSFRVKAIGSKGAGPWSSPVTSYVT